MYPSQKGRWWPQSPPRTLVLPPARRSPSWPTGFLHGCEGSQHRLGHLACDCGQAEPAFGENLGYCAACCHFQWHKENLPSKGFTKPTPRLALPTSLDGQMRVFMRKGLDDFGSGSLPRVCHGAPQPAPKKRQNKLPVEVALPAKLLAARQAWRAFLEDVEAQLAPHPLALYPHLEEDMPVELLLKVLEVLDPDRKLEDSWAYCQGIRKRTKEPTQLLKKCSTQVSLGLSKKSPVSHPGQWLYEEKKPVETHLLHEGGPYHENVHKVVRDFCNWATTFGSSHIDEEFILKQFDIDYQSKPSCDVFHPIRPSQVPLELKKRVELNKLQKLEFSQKLDSEKKLQKPQTLRPAALLFGVLSFPMTSPWLTIVSLPEVPLLPCLPAHSFLWTQNPCKPKYVKMRYGAWYLKTDLWKKQRVDEPLVDPKISCKAQDENCKNQLQGQELLADLHGIAAFKDFILSRGYRMPSLTL
nr:protein FAM47E isoform X2 [Manis javanica]